MMEMLLHVISVSDQYSILRIEQWVSRRNREFDYESMLFLVWKMKMGGNHWHDHSGWKITWVTSPAGGLHFTWKSNFQTQECTHRWMGELAAMQHSMERIEKQGKGVPVWRQIKIRSYEKLHFVLVGKHLFEDRWIERTLKSNYTWSSGKCK